MDLGDGLMFELENGKPKLVLFTKRVESRNAKKAIPITRPEKVALRLKQTHTKPPSGELPRAQERNRINLQPTAASHEHQECPKAPTRASFKEIGGDCRASAQAGAPPRAWPADKPIAGKQASSQKHPEGSGETLKESLACLTQQQLQQILSSINGTTDGNAHSQPQSEGRRGDIKEDMAMKGTESDARLHLPSAHKDKNDKEWENGTGDRVISNGLPASLFSTLGEREREREVLEAKRAQWKKELDEQMALKRLKKGSPDVSQNCCGRRSDSTPSAGETLTEVEEERILGRRQDGKLQQSRVGVCHSQRDLPAAIRSAFILGEATPLEHAFSAEKQEDRRKWLEELDRQREEAKLRRMQERQARAQGEDLDCWAMHFDSLQKTTLSRAPRALKESDSGPPSTPSTSRRLSPPSSSSLAWEGMSTLGGDPLDWASVESNIGVAQRTSHLRTMTALLDPAQIEERERKRLKQLEHQRAIAAQVEERRRQREQEEARRQAEEQAEERRLVQERERLEQQYQLDALEQRRKEELQAQKAEELYLSVQRAQEEALRARQRQRIQELSRKGHDISKLLHQLEGARVSMNALTPKDLCSLGNDDGLQIEASSTASLRKDTAVQTDADTLGLGSAEAQRADGGLVEIPDVPVERHSTKKAKRDGQALGRKAVKGKENARMAGDSKDPYEGFAHTGRDHRQPGWNMRKPGKPFVPASERYPPGPRQRRQESRLQRQADLLALAGKYGVSRPVHREPSTTHLSHRHKPPPQKKEEDPRCTSVSHVDNDPQPTPSTDSGFTRRPPSSTFVPYMRTDEVYHLDPLAPISRPSTQELQPHVQPGINHGKLTSDPLQRDPLLNPEVLKNKERQQAILKGLSELRQGLLLKQREMETGLGPLQLGPDAMI